MKQYDYILVGQGIVGSNMALALLRKGKSVMVIDAPKLSSSSRIAAGVYNPFNFRQMMNNWRAVEMINAAKDLYYFAEKISEQKIFTERKILKVFTSADERKLWERACEEKEGLLSDEKVLENYLDGFVISPYGMGVVNNGGSIDTGMLIYVVAEKLKEENSFLEECFDPEKLEIKPDGIIYDEKISAKHIVFCEGHLATYNPWFNFLPIKPAKGQLLHIHIPGLHFTEVINRGAYLLPLGNELFVLGSTFDNDVVDEIPTKYAEEDLLSRAEKFIKVPIKIVSRYAGIRPAVQDRRPIIGTHPDFPQLSIINGMGSKAVLLSPWLAEKLIEHIENGNEIPKEVAVNRFQKK
ncbi:MAG: FAD-dependent oxidoreductase [Bacteroidetes bacterium]|nr:FAD-dependent oxidoreductase [Bacteroidota bacterium]